MADEESPIDQLLAGFWFLVPVSWFKVAPGAAEGFAVEAVVDGAADLVERTDGGEAPAHAGDAFQPREVAEEMQAEFGDLSALKGAEGNEKALLKTRGE